MDSLFFWVSKLAWLVIAPDSLLVILLLVAWVLLRRRRYRGALHVLGATVALVLVIALLPVGGWLLAPLETRMPANPELPPHVDGIVVLGGSELPVNAAHWQQVEVNDAAERHLALLSLARRFPQARLVHTGGSGSLVHQHIKESVVVERLYRDQGLDLSRVVLEGQSRNTYENARRSLEVVRPGPHETWVLITTAWHMPRAIGVFCQAGWPVIPYPVDHWTIPGKALTLDINFAEHLRSLRYALREWLGLTVYYLTGKTPALLPERCDATP